jgi:hypothetical protein
MQAFGPGSTNERLLPNNTQHRPHKGMRLRVRAPRRWVSVSVRQADRENAEVDMQKPYEDRTDAKTYLDDVQCQFRLQPHPRDEGSKPIEVWISERLLARTRHLGQAYELPLLSRLPSAGATTYPEIQLASMEDELAFMFSVVSDQVLLDAIDPIREMLRVAMHDPRGWSLIVETP